MHDEKRFYDPEYCRWLEDEVRRYRAQFIRSLPGSSPHGQFKLEQDIERVARRGR